MYDSAVFYFAISGFIGCIVLMGLVLLAYIKVDDIFIEDKKNREKHNKLMVKSRLAIWKSNPRTKHARIKNYEEEE